MFLEPRLSTDFKRVYNIAMEGDHRGLLSIKTGIASIIWKNAVFPGFSGLLPFFFSLHHLKAVRTIIERWVRKAQNGDKEAFVRLMGEYETAMYGTAKAILHNEADVQDAVQEALCRAFYKLHTLRQPKFFKTWLTRVVINCCYDLLRQQRGLVPLDLLPEEGQEEDRDLSLDVRRALAALGENDRLILTLYYLNDIPVKEIAKLLGITEGAAKMRLYHGRKKFKETFGANGKEAGL